jgi:DNA-binding transcriptional MerR regulator
MAKSGGGAGRARLKMKDLERATGVGRESIRFYIREGLLPEPRRPGRNVAWYDESFVERIKLIKELQQNRFLPLRVIKTIVAGDAPPTPIEVQALGTLEGRLPQVVDAALEAPAERLSVLAKRTSLPVREIQELASVEAIAIVTRDGDQWIEGVGVRLIELWARFRAAGFTAERGFGPEQVRLYVDMVRWLAREELREFTTKLAGRVDADELVHLAEEGIQLGSEVVALLRRAALLRFIGEGNLADPITPGTRSSGSAV